MCDCLTIYIYQHACSKCAFGLSHNAAVSVQSWTTESRSLKPQLLEWDSIGVEAESKALQDDPCRLLSRHHEGTIRSAI